MVRNPYIPLIGRNHLNNELRLQDIAAVLNTLAHYLSQIFGRYLETTFFDYMKKRRIETAKILIMVIQYQLS